MTSYYIMYPKNKQKKVKIVGKRPNPNRNKNYGFAEGSFKSKSAVKKRLNQMNIPAKRRPEGY